MDNTQQQIVENIPGLRRYARALLRDNELADDLVQDCLVRAMSRLHLWEAGSNMKTWLFSILHNLHVNAMRRSNKQPDNTALEPVHETINARQPDQDKGLLIRDMDRALEHLPDDQRAVILLIGLEQVSYAEAGDILGIPTGTVMSRLNRGRTRLREILDTTDTPNIRRVK